MTGFNELRKAISLAGKHPVSAKVTAINPVQMVATVIIEGETVEYEEVPLRIFTDEDNLGAVIVPKIGSEVLIVFIDGNGERPQIIKVQQWEYIIARRGTGNTYLEFIIDSENTVSLKLGNSFRALIEQNAHVKINNSSKYELDLAADGKLTMTTEKDIDVHCTNINVHASGNIDLGESGSGVLVNQLMPFCYVTGAPIPCSRTVKAKV